MANKTAKPVGNKSTEMILGSASQKLNTGLKSLQEVVGQLASMDALIEEKTLKLSNMDNEIADLNVRKQQEIENDKFEIELAYKQNSRDFVNQFLTANQLELISRDELSDLKRAIAERDQTIKAEVAKEVAIRTKQMEADFKIKELQLENTQATVKADLDQKNQQIRYLEDNIKRLSDEITAQRELTKNIAEAGKVGSINVGGAPTGR